MLLGLTTESVFDDLCFVLVFNPVSVYLTEIKTELAPTATWFNSVFISVHSYFCGSGFALRVKPPEILLLKIWRVSVIFTCRGFISFCDGTLPEGEKKKCHRWCLSRCIGWRPVPEAVGICHALLLCPFFTSVHVLFCCSFLVLKCFTATCKIIRADFQAKVLIGTFPRLCQTESTGKQIIWKPFSANSGDTWRNYSLPLESSLRLK